MKKVLLTGLLLAAVGCSESAKTDVAAPEISLAAFESLSYQGQDPVYEQMEDVEGTFVNPVLPGFYPDPSITEANGTYYTVNSTFAFFPGIPVFESKDLVNWTQIGNVIDRPGMLDFGNLGLSRGVFAPTIEYHDGVFYVANTCVDCGGNFIVTADHPAGPWSDPVWLPEVGGIDPSLFFQNDGTVWLMNNDAPPGGSTYEGHRAVWIRQIDPETFQSISEPVVIMDGGVRPEENPIWIEGPHIYFKNGWYYFSAAEGGTAEDHSQVIARSRNVDGPYEPFEGNPILTQRHLPADRPFPVTSVGHADYVQDGAGNWWVVFLGVRPYEANHFNTGRETFLLPVDWSGDWPVILEGDDVVPMQLPRPEFPDLGTPVPAPDGNFQIFDNFEDGMLADRYLSIREGSEGFTEFSDGQLKLSPRPVELSEFGRPSFVGIRQQHAFANFTTVLVMDDLSVEDEAGLAAIQSDDFHYAFGVVGDEDGQTKVVLRRRAGPDMPLTGEVVAEALLDDRPNVLTLEIRARGSEYDFVYQTESGDEQILASGVDGTVLSTSRAGGFVGAVVGPYAIDR